MTISQATSVRPDDGHCYTPIISVADLPESSFPTVMIPDCKYQPLCDTGARRAKNSFGTIDALVDLTKGRLYVKQKNRRKDGLSYKERRVVLPEESEIPGETTMELNTPETTDVGSK